MNTIATQITQRASERQPYVVGISGGSASGKSYFSERLAEELEKSGYQVTIINQDDFAIGRNFKNKHTSPYKWDDPENYRLDECLAVLDSLKSGQPAKLKAYTLKAHEPAFIKTIPSHANQARPYIIIIEGLFAWYGPMENSVGYKLYIDGNFYRRFVLRLNRNVHESKHTDVDTVVRQYFTHVARAEADLLLPMKLTADEIIHRSVPLPPISGTPAKLQIDKLIYRDQELIIGLSSDKTPHLIVDTPDGTLFDETINEENVAVLTGWILKNPIDSLTKL